METIVHRVIARLLKESNRSREIHVFDFDDTLVRTNSRIRVKSSGGDFFLSPQEYAKYKRRPGDVFDYSDFEQVIEPELIPSTFLKLKAAIDSNGNDNVFILTARGNPVPVKEFLSSVGVDGIRIFATGTSDPQAKARIIEDEVNSRRIKRVYFYDDAAKNIEAVKNLRRRLPDVEIVTTRMK